MLGTVPLLRGLDPAALAELEQVLVPTNYVDGAAVVVLGEVGRAMYFIGAPPPLPAPSTSHSPRAGPDMRQPSDAGTHPVRRVGRGGGRDRRGCSA
jgi:hypothetical protein